VGEREHERGSIDCDSRGEVSDSVVG
jgi:hypothetical protein